MHGNSLVLRLGGNFVHPLCPLLHCFGGGFGGLGVVLAYAHVAVLEDSLELVFKMIALVEVQDVGCVFW